MLKYLAIPQSIKYIFTGGIFVFFVFFVFKHHEDFYVIQNISTLQFIATSLLILFGVTLNGSKLNRIAINFGVQLRTGEWFALSSMTTVLNSVFFKAGSIATSGYLKKKYSFPYSSFAGAFLGDQLIILFLGVLCAQIQLDHSSNIHFGTIHRVSDYSFIKVPFRLANYSNRIAYGDFELNSKIALEFSIKILTFSNGAFVLEFKIKP